MSIKNYKKEPKTIFDISSRTMHKIIARANIKCSICKWNQATGDIHHIIEVSEGGSNNMNNLIYICPNCHRCIHQLGDKFKTREELQALSLDKTFPNWLDFYNPKRSKNFEVNKDIKNNCLTCDKEIPHHKKFCDQKCSGNSKQVQEWSFDLLDTILKKYKGNLTKSGKELKVSDNAVKKQCIKFNIDYKAYKNT